MYKEKILSEARAANACRQGLKAFLNWKGDNDSFAMAYPSFGLWAVGKCPSFEVSAAVLDKCAEAAPTYALEYAAKNITPERLDKCAEAMPGIAMLYAAEHLTPERLDKCAEAAPGNALECAAERLTPERIDKCAEAMPGIAMLYAAEHLTPERKTWCEKQINPA